MKRAEPWPATARVCALVTPSPDRPPFCATLGNDRIPGAGGVSGLEPADGPTWMPTASALAVDLLAPKMADIRIGDIAAALAKVNRWNGTTPTPYSVAQHSVHVSRQVERVFAQYALLHDAHEAYLGDDSSPKQAAIRALLAGQGCDFDPVGALKARFDQAIFLAFGLPWPMAPHIALAVKYADMRALATEKRDLAPAADRWAEVSLPPPYADRIRPMPWPKAEDAFIARFKELFGETFL